MQDYKDYLRQISFIIIIINTNKNTNGLSAGLQGLSEYYLLLLLIILLLYLYDKYFICNNSNNVLLLDKWVGLSAGLQGLSSANLLHYYYQYINVYQNSYSYSLSSIGWWKTRIVLKLSPN